MTATRPDNAELSAMIHQRLTNDDIAGYYGVSRATVAGWRRKLVIIPPPVKKETRRYRRWEPIIARAKEIVDSYVDTKVTLRQLFYRLVSDGTLDNTEGDYGHLSSKTAEARRDGLFPDLIDNNRSIWGLRSWDSPQEAIAHWRMDYCRDRTEGQECAIYLGVEKAGLVDQLWSWFGNYGVSILSTGSYASQTYLDRINVHLIAENRPAVLIYGGDFDPSGEDIYRHLVARTHFDHKKKIALTYEQVQEYNLVINPGKSADNRAKAFVKKYGTNMQVELNALTPEHLQNLYTLEFERHWDNDKFKAALEQEAEDKAQLAIWESWQR